MMLSYLRYGWSLLSLSVLGHFVQCGLHQFGSLKCLIEHFSEDFIVLSVFFSDKPEL